MIHESTRNQTPRMYTPTPIHALTHAHTHTLTRTHTHIHTLTLPESTACFAACFPAKQQVMTPKEKLITGTKEMCLDDCNQVMQDSRKGKLPIVNDQFELVALISRSGLCTGLCECDGALRLHSCTCKHTCLLLLSFVPPPSSLSLSLSLSCVSFFRLTSLPLLLFNRVPQT